MWNQDNISVYLVNAGEGVDVTGYLFSEDIFFNLAAPLQYLSFLLYDFWVILYGVHLYIT